MANKKLSELTALLGADVAVDDLLMMFDTSTTGTKKITRAEFFDAMFKDEDDMASDSATHGASQQSVKAYVDQEVSDAATQWLTDQATTSGTAFDFTVPSTAREIAVHFCGTSLDVAGYFLVQLMVSGSPVTTGYSSGASSSGVDSYREDGFHVFRSSAAHVSGGRMDVCRVGSGAWSASHSVSLSGAESNGGGFITGVGTVTGIRVTRTTGNFDAGSVNVSYR